jgi:hypothetical protein
MDEEFTKQIIEEEEKNPEFNENEVRESIYFLATTFAIVLLVISTACFSVLYFNTNSELVDTQDSLRDALITQISMTDTFLEGEDVVLSLPVFEVNGNLMPMLINGEIQDSNVTLSLIADCAGWDIPSPVDVGCVVPEGEVWRVEYISRVDKVVG